MSSWTDATAPGLTRELWRAVVRPERLERSIVRELLPASGAWEPWVEQVWSLAWSEPVPAAASSLISHPTAQVTLEAGPDGEVRHGHAMPAALLHGPTTQRFGPDLPAFGWVVGLHVRPGMLRDLTGVPTWRWTDRIAPWGALGGLLAGWDLESVWAARGPLARAYALAEEAERRLACVTPSALARRASRLEALVREDPTLRTAAQLADREGMSPRTLQRLCRDQLGVTPQWLLRRARVLDAHELLSTTDMPVAEVAASLGWYDQAHFSRDYTAVTGSPPAGLRRERDTPT